MNTNKKQIFFNELFFKLNKLIATFIVIGAVLSCGSDSIATPSTTTEGSDIKLSAPPASISTKAVALTLTLNEGHDYTRFVLRQGEKIINENIDGVDQQGVPLTEIKMDPIDGLNPNESYTFSIEACKGETCSEERVSFTVVTKPDPLVTFDSVKEKNTSTSLWLTWDAPTDGGADNYTLYRGDNNEVVVAEEIEVTEQEVGGLEPGTPYTFSLVACNSEGLCSSANTKEFTTPPGKVEELKASDPDGIKVTISWKEAPQTTTYYVVSKQKKDDPTSEVVKNDLEVNVTQYDIPSLAENTTYTFSIRACSGSGCSDPVTTEAVMTSEAGSPPASAPVLTYTSVSSTAVELKWDPVVEATYFPVFYTNITDGGPEVSNYVANDNKFATADDALTANTQYKFWVKACNQKGCSGNSDELSLTTAPEAPGDFTIEDANVTSTNVTFTWVGVTGGAKSYVIYRNGSAIATNIGESLSTTYTAKELNANTEYGFSVKACGGDGCSSETGVATVVTKPASPVLNFVEDENTSTSLSFTWEAPEGGAEYYTLYRGANNEIVVAEKIAALKQEAVGLTPGTPYTFSLVACNVNDLCSVASTRTVTTPPSPVTGLAIKGDPTSTTVTISWTEPSETTSYVVSKQKKDDPASKVEVGNTLGTGATEFTIPDLIPETTYIFSIQACNDAGCSDSEVIEGTTVAILNSPASAPVNLTNTSVSSTAVELAWDSVDAATYYPVFYTNITDGGPEVSNSVANDNKFATADDALTANTQYEFWVRACNEEGCFEGNSVKLALTTAPVAVAGLSATGGPGTVELSWTTSEGATHYVIDYGSGTTTTNDDGGISGEKQTETIYNLDTASEYIFQVVACNDFGCSVESEATATTSPDQPESVVPGVVTSSTIALSWSKVDKAESYVIHLNYNPIATNTGVDNTDYTVRDLDPNRGYSFSVAACVEDSSVCSYTTDTDPVTIITAPAVPGVPENLSAGTITANSIELGWNAVTGAEYYIVYTNSSGSSFPIVTNTGTSGTPPAATYTADELDASTQYSFSVKACNVTGCSAESTAVQATTDQEAPVVPDIPADFVLEAMSSTTVSLTWGEVTGASSYIIYQDGNAIATNTGTSGTPPATTYTADKLTANTPYTFLVKACNITGCSGETFPVDVTTAPGTPQNLKADNIQINSIDLSWNVVTGAEYYIVYTNSSGSSFPVATNGGDNPATTHPADGLIGGTEYTFTVRACNTSFRITGCSLEATVNARTVTDPSTVPEVPQNLRASTTSHSIELSWDKVTGAEYYIVYTNRYRRPSGSLSSSSGTSFPVATIRGDNPATTYTASGLTALIQYSFSVRACDVTGCSARSEEFRPITDPEAPENLMADDTITTSSIGLSWDAITGNEYTTTRVAYYIIYRDGNAIATNTGSPPATTYNATGLDAGTGYSFSVKSCSEFGCSAESTAVQVATDPDNPDIPEIPQTLVASIITVNSISLSWDRVTWANSYIVYRDGNAIATNTGTTYRNTRTNYRAVGLNADSGYAFSVKACNNSGCSDASAPVTFTTLIPPDFFTISYPKMASEASATSMPVIVSGNNCNLETLTAEGKVTYGIDYLTEGRSDRVLLQIDSTTGVVDNKNGSSTAGIYQVTVTVPDNTACNTNVLVYNTFIAISEGNLRTHIFPYGSTALHGDRGNYNYIDTSQVKRLHSMFVNKSTFNGDISGWDTSQVTIMDSMFDGASKFNGDITKWNTSKVGSMRFMFRNASEFNQDISGWNTLGVGDMQSMFENTRKFNQPIGKWKTHNVGRMDGMFRGAIAFDQPLNSWNTSKVTTMPQMFRDAANFNQPLSNWVTSQVGSMYQMFYGASRFDQDLSMWDVTSAGTPTEVFKGSAMQGEKGKYPDSSWTP